MRNVSMILALVIGLATTALAADKKMPDKMTTEDAARWDAALAHEQLVMEQVAPYEKTIADLCKKYAIERAALGHTVAVDAQTGEIKRVMTEAPAKPEPPKPTKSTPPKK